MKREEMVERAKAHILKVTEVSGRMPWDRLSDNAEELADFALEVTAELRERVERLENELEGYDNVVPASDLKAAYSVINKLREKVGKYEKLLAAADQIRGLGDNGISVKWTVEKGTSNGKPMWSNYGADIPVVSYESALDAFDAIQDAEAAGRKE